MRSTLTSVTLRRLLAADGYLHLELPGRAIDELRKIDNAGALEGTRQLMLGIALKRSGNSEAAVEHLEQAARTMPGAIRSFAWSELASCYRDVGSRELADLAETLGGDRVYELCIALPGGQISLCSTDSATEMV